MHNLHARDTLRQFHAASQICHIGCPSLHHCGSNGSRLTHDLQQASHRLTMLGKDMMVMKSRHALVSAAMDLQWVAGMHYFDAHKSHGFAPRAHELL